MLISENNNYQKVETKDKRVQLLIQPSVHKRIEKMASDLGISVNEFINLALIERITQLECQNSVRSATGNKVPTAEGRQVATIKNQIVFDVEKEIAILAADIRGCSDILDPPPWIVERLYELEEKLEQCRKG